MLTMFFVNQTSVHLKLMRVMDAKYTLPNISPSAVRRVEGQSGAAA